MKKFARCVLILILVVIISGVGGYFYEDNTITPMYESVAQLYVVPGTQSEASIRAKDGGLNKDFMIIFSSNVVIEAAQRIAGTTEDISQYLTVSSPADSNIVELKIVNPDQNTAKTYVDAVAQTAVKTTTIIPVESMQILSEGTSSGVSFKQHLYRNTIFIAGAAGVVCIFIEIIVCLILCAFKKKEDRSDDEYEYEARYGRYVYPRHELIDSDAKRLPHENARKASSDDILAAFDDEEDDDDEDIDFLTKNVMKNAEADYQKEVAGSVTTSVSGSEDISGSGSATTSGSGSDANAFATTASFSFSISASGSTSDSVTDSGSEDISGSGSVTTSASAIISGSDSATTSGSGSAIISGSGSATTSGSGSATTSGFRA